MLQPDGGGPLLPITDQDWSPIDERPHLGELKWDGTGVWDGLDVNWSLLQVLAYPDPGIYEYFEIFAGGGYYMNLFYYENGLSWPAGANIPFTGSIFLDATPPFSLFGTVAVKGRQWHETT